MYYFGGQLDFKSEGNNILYYYYYYEGTRIKSTTLMNATKQTKPTTKINKMDINKAHNKISHISKVVLHVTIKQLTWRSLEFFSPVRGVQLQRQKLRTYLRF